MSYVKDGEAGRGERSEVRGQRSEVKGFKFKVQGLRLELEVKGYYCSLFTIHRSPFTVCDLNGFNDLTLCEKK
jgi:hypothetical protein